MVNRGFCSFVGFKYELNCSCFRRDVQDNVLDSLGGKREGCPRAGSTQRRPVLPSPAPPRRPAVRRPDPTGTRQGGGAGPGRTGRRKNGSPRRQPTLAPPQGIVETCHERPPRSTNKRNPINNDGGTQRPVDDRFISRTTAALRFRLLTSGPVSFCRCKPFSCQACPEKKGEGSCP